MKKIAAILFIALIGMVTITGPGSTVKAAYEWAIDGECVEEQKKDIKEQVIHFDQPTSITGIACNLTFLIHVNILPHPHQGIHLPPPDLSC